MHEIVNMLRNVWMIDNHRRVAPKAGVALTRVVNAVPRVAGLLLTHDVLSDGVRRCCVGCTLGASAIRVATQAPAWCGV